MPTKDITTHCITFLVGVFTGAGATYFGNKFTDKRRDKELAAKARRQLREVEKQMPELIKEIRKDLANPENQIAREFFVCRRGSVLNVARPCIVYYENDHYNLRSKVLVLENHGYIIDVTPGNAPKYRMTEEFVRLLLNKR